MRFERFEVPGLAHYSYLIGSGSDAVVVDPKRDIDTYTSYASTHGLKITHILETHIHADYASGALQLAHETGAELWLSAHDKDEEFEYKFPHHAFKDSEELRLGDVRLVALHTPGHTPEHLSFLVFDLARCASQPVLLLSGDFLFVGSLGRPDLLGEAAKQRLARDLFHSVNSKLAGLPDGLEVHPAHGAGSLCGAGMSERQQSTLGYERICNAFFSQPDEQSFTQKILSSVPPFPDYYRRMKKINSDGPSLLQGLPGDQALTAAELRKLVKAEEVLVLDLRRPEAFGGAHIPGAYNIGAGQNLSMWAAWVLPYDRPIVLVDDAQRNYEEARRSLIRVGLDDVRGYLKGGMEAWIEARFEQAHIPQEAVTELEQKIGRGAHVLDVRSDGEWNSGHIEGAQHIMAGELPKRLDEIPKTSDIHVVCGSGYRSSIASSILRKNGFDRIFNVVGGMTAWNNRGLPVTSKSGAVFNV